MNTVFFDIDSQLDFLYPAGALYVPGAERIVPAIARLNRYAAAHGIPVVSTTDAHTEDDPEFQIWPHHCVAGNVGAAEGRSDTARKAGSDPEPRRANSPLTARSRSSSRSRPWTCSPRRTWRASWSGSGRSVSWSTASSPRSASCTRSAAC